MIKARRSFSAPTFTALAAVLVAIGIFVVFHSFAATNSITYSGKLSPKTPSQTKALAISASGTLTAQLTYSKISNVSLQLIDPNGIVVTSANGPSPINLSSPVSSGTYQLKVSGSGSGSYSVTATYPVPGDTTSPTIAVTQPTSGATISGTVTVSGTASDNVSLSKVELSVNGGAFQPATGTTNWTYSLNTTTLTNASHTITVRAVDSSSNIASASVTVTVSNSSDTTPPSAPTNLSVPSRTSTSITLAWNPSTDNVGVTGYKIYRGGTEVGSTAQTTYTDTGLAPNTTYSYYVKAYDAAGNLSAASNTMTPNTNPLDTTPPSAPGLSAGITGSNQVSLSWSAGTDNVGITGYQIYRNSVQLATSTTTNYTDSNLTAGTTYSYYVKAYDAAGNLSAASNTANVNCCSFFIKVSVTSPASQDVVKGTVAQTISASGSYNITTVVAALDGGTSANATVSSGGSWTLPSLDTTKLANGTHTIVATATDQFGNKSTSNATFYVDNAPPSAPANLTSPSQSFNNLNLTWSASTDAVGVTGYQIYRNGAQIGYTTTNSYIDTGLTASTTYSYYVKAYNGAGLFSSASNALSVNTTGPDTTLPTVNISTPANSSTVSGMISFTGTANDNLAVQNVRIQNKNGGATYTAVGTANWSYNLDSTYFGNGAQTFIVTATDTSGNTNTASVTLTFNNPVGTGDTTKPTIQISNPPNPATGTAAGPITPLAYDYDGTGVTRLEYQIGSYPVVAIPITAATFVQPSFSLDSTHYADGTYYFYVNAYDAAGNMGQAISQITIRNSAHYDDKTYPDGAHITVDSVGTNPSTGSFWTADAIHNLLTTCTQNSGDFAPIATNSHLQVNVRDHISTMTLTSYSASGGNVTPGSFVATVQYDGTLLGNDISHANATSCYEFGHVWNQYYAVTVHNASYSLYTNYRWLTADGTLLATNDVCVNFFDGYSGCMSGDYGTLVGSFIPGSTQHGEIANNQLVAPTAQPGLANWLLTTWRGK